MKTFLSIIALSFLPISVFAAPAKPFIAWSADPTSSSYSLTWNMWWGENGSTVKLEENGVVVETKTITSGSPQAQSGTFALSDRANGAYTYKVFLCDAQNCTVSDSKKLTVRGSTATSTTPPVVWTTTSPAKPFIAWSADPTSSSYSLTWNMWWGENGSTVKLEENGVVVETKTITSGSPQAQSGTFALTNRTSNTYEYRIILCKGNICTNSDITRLRVLTSTAPVILPITPPVVNTGSTNTGTVIPPVITQSWSFIFGESTLRMLRSALPITGKPIVDFVDINNNQANVVRLLRILPETKWNEFFPVRKSIYTYQNFVLSVAKFPAFCNDKASDVTFDLDTVCRSELATLFGNFAQETGWNSPSGYLPDNPGVIVPVWKQALYAIREIGCENGGCSYRSACDDSYYGKIWQCPPDARYYGRGAIQLSYSFNYGPFSKVMLWDQNILLKNPDLVAQDGWLALSSALWFYMTPGTPKPSAHDVMVGHWKPNAADIASGNTAGFGAIVNIVNGAVECGKGSLSSTTQSRIQHFRDFTTALGGRLGDNLSCANAQIFPATWAAAIPSYWDKSWDGTTSCQLVSWQTGFSLFIPDSYKSCVEFNFGVTPTKVPTLPTPGMGLAGSTNIIIPPTWVISIVDPVNISSSVTTVTPPKETSEPLTLSRKRALMTNISTGMRDTPILFRNESSFRTAYSYAARIPTEKTFLDAVWNMVKVSRTDASKSRILRLVWNIGVGLRDDVQAFLTRNSYNTTYSYNKKNSSLQKVMDELWLIIGQ